LSIIIPAYNEESVIGSTLGKIVNFLRTKPYKSEIIVVNDGSKDHTYQEVKKYQLKYSTADFDNIHIRLINNSKNMNKGKVVKQGVLNCNGKYLAILDADYAYPIKQIDTFLDALQSKWDLAIGNRTSPETSFLVSPRAFSYIYSRYLLSRTFNFIVRKVIIKDIRDTQCGIKCFRREVAKDIFRKVTISDFSYDVEVLFIAQRYGKKIIQLPVIYNYIDEPSTVSLFRDAIKMLISISRIRVKGWLNKY